MSRIPPLTTLRVEDFDAEQRKWLPRLFLPLNQFFTAVSSAINGRIEFVTNVPAQDQTLDFTFDGSSAQKFAWRLDATLPPKILWVGQATEAGLAVAVFAQWAYDPSTATISVTFTKSNGSALTTGAEYKIFIRTVP